MINQNKQIGKTIIISGFGAFLTYAINFVLTPYITSTIGIDAYGFVSIAKTVTSYADIAMTALTSFIVRYISVSYHEANFKDANEYYSSSVYACFVFSMILFLMASIISIRLECILVIPNALIKPVKILFLVIFFNFVVTTMNVPLGVYAYIQNRLDITGMIKIFGSLLEVLVLYFLFQLFPTKLWYVGLGSLSASFVAMVCNALAIKKYTPKLIYKRDNVSFLKIRNLVKNGVWNSLNSIGNVLNSGLDLLVSNLMLSGTATGQIAVSKTIGTMFQTLFIVVSQSFQPQMLKSYATGKIEDFLSSLKKAMIVCGWFANVAFAGFVTLGTLYFKLWLPEEDTYILYYLTVLTVISFVTEGVLQPVYYISTLTVKNKIPCWITIIGGLCNVFGMYILIQNTKLGVYAVAVTTAVVMITINLIFNPLYAAWCLKIKSREIYTILVRDLISCVIMVVTFIQIRKKLMPTNWLGLITSALIMCTFALPIHMMCMYNSKDIRTILKKWFLRKSVGQ